MSIPPKFTLDEILAELKDEIGMRRRVYGEKVAQGRMKKEDMERKISIMERVKYDYEQMKLRNEGKQGSLL